jgi:hypothetical protein
MAARPLIGAMGTNNPLLRPGINVNFAQPGMSFDIPKPGPQYRGTAEGFTGSLMYPEYHTGLFLPRS